MSKRRRSFDSCIGGNGGDSINDEKREGYLINKRGKIVGEARNFDPYSLQGEIMMYDVDSFGFMKGYLRRKHRFMSEEDIINDLSLYKELKVVKYKQWKRHNLVELMKEYRIHGKRCKNFDYFCRKIYGNLKKE